MVEHPIAADRAASPSADHRRLPQLERIEKMIRSLERRAESTDPSTRILRQPIADADSRLRHSVVIAESAASRDTFFLCHQESELVAASYLATSRDQPEVGTLSLVAVDARLRRRGLATTLSARARDAFFEQGGGVLFLGLGENGNPPAFRIYHRLGWRKLAGANIMALVAGGASPESFLVDYFGERHPVATAAGVIATDGIPMLPLLYTPHDWQVLDANAGILSTRYATQNSCMALFWRYEALRRDGDGDWFVARDDRGRIVGLSSARLASPGYARIDAFAHPTNAECLPELAARATEWAVERGVSGYEVSASLEDEDRHRFFEILGFRKREIDSRGFELDLRTVPAIRMEKRLHGARAPALRRSEDATRRSVRAAAAVAPILNATLDHLRQRYPEHVSARSIRRLRLDHYFTVLELDDGSVGSCMSYFRFPLRVLEIVQSKVDETRARDPLLTDLLFDAPLEELRDQEALLVSNLQAAIVGALSDRFLRAGGDEGFSASETRPYDPFAGAERALVLGFGGYMERLVELPGIRELHISDLSYIQRRGEMEARLERYRSLHPGKQISISDGHDTELRLSRVDVVSITGSALCNGSLDRLLAAARRGRPRVVVQGASASVHPQVLFERGVDFVATMLKPPELVRLVELDPERNGRFTRPVLERQLPWIYLTPKPKTGGEASG